MSSSNPRRALNTSSNSTTPAAPLTHHPRSESLPSSAPPHPAAHTTYESFADLIPTSPPPGSPPRRSWIAASPILGSFNRSRRTGWRGSLGGESADDGGADGAGEGRGDGDGEDDGEGGDGRRLAKRLSTWRLVLLTVGLAGAQLTWTVEMA